MMNTLLLNPTEWDFLVDADGNIAMASNPYSLSQDIASAIKLFQGEAYYNQSLGVPYFQNILGYNESATFIGAQLEAAARSVPGVVEARLVELAYNGRTLIGALDATDTTGIEHNVTF